VNQSISIPSKQAFYLNIVTWSYFILRNFVRYGNIIYQLTYLGSLPAESVLGIIIMLQMQMMSVMDREKYISDLKNQANAISKMY
jgi:hypothetical protein